MGIFLLFLAVYSLSRIPIIILPQLAFGVKKSIITILVQSGRKNNLTLFFPVWANPVQYSKGSCIHASRAYCP